MEFKCHKIDSDGCRTQLYPIVENIYIFLVSDKPVKENQNLVFPVKLVLRESFKGEDIASFTLYYERDFDMVNAMATQYALLWLSWCIY